MVQNYRLFSYGLLNVVIVVMIVAGASLAIAEEGYGEDDFNPIRLVLTVDQSGKPFIYVNPSRAKLWRATPGRPWMIFWTAANSSPYQDVYWEIRHDPGDDAESVNYFGDFDIPCGENFLATEPISKPEIEKAQWRFRVTAYACYDGVKGPKKAEFNAAPRILWKD